MGVQCYWLEPIRQARLSLRCYSSANGCPLVPGEYNYHNAHTSLFDVVETFEFNEAAGRKLYEYEGPHERADVSPKYQWPTHCGCGYEFIETDSRQVFSETLYKRSDTGAILTQREFGPGAMWNAEYLNDNEWLRGPDGMSLSVICPNGREWLVDGPCSNCTKPEDKIHKCWCRSGAVPNITVDKNCNSCDAGAGSIQAGDYHGFLVNGCFT